MTTASTALAMPAGGTIVAGVDEVRPQAGRAAKRTRDPAIKIIVALSLAAHVGLILPMIVERDQATPIEREIPVEIIQEPAVPPAAAPKPPPAAPKPAAPKPPAAAPKPPAAAAKPPGAASKPPAAAPKPPQRQPAPQQQKADPQQTPEQQRAAQETAQQQRQVADRMEKLFGAMPAIVLPGTSDTGDEQVSYKQLVLSKVAKAKPEGRSRGIPGAASVAFSIGDQGEVVRCEIVRKSVDPKLDAEAIAMIQRGAPYPPPPAGEQRDFVVTLRFAAIP